EPGREFGPGPVSASRAEQTQEYVLSQILRVLSVAKLAHEFPNDRSPIPLDQLSERSHVAAPDAHHANGVRIEPVIRTRSYRQGGHWYPSLTQTARHIHAAVAAAGSRTRNVLPCPTLLSTLTVPPSRLTYPLTIDSPKPAWSSLAFRDGSAR